MKKGNDTPEKVEKAKDELYHRLNDIVTDEFLDRLYMEDVIDLLNKFIRESEYLLFEGWLTESIERRLKAGGIELAEEKGDQAFGPKKK